jgi:hypothetical protein
MRTSSWFVHGSHDPVRLAQMASEEISHLKNITEKNIHVFVVTIVASV